jgi:hypothetical protein
VIGVLALPEQLDAGFDDDLGAAADQFRQLALGQSVKEAEAAQVVDTHQIVAR